jgi:hypothetical protein
MKHLPCAGIVLNFTNIDSFNLTTTMILWLLSLHFTDGERLSYLSSVILIGSIRDGPHSDVANFKGYLDLLPVLMGIWQVSPVGVEGRRQQSN